MLPVVLAAGASVDNTPPTVPAGLQATALSCSEVQLRWQASTDEGGSSVRGYRIFRNSQLVTEVAASLTAFMDTGLSPSATYNYTVSAMDTSGNESLPCPPSPGKTTVCDDTTPPTAPGGLAAVPVSCDSVSLNWTPSLDAGGSGIRGYRIIRNGAFVTEVSAGTTSFIDAGLSPERTYSYRVSAKDRSNNESDQSDAATAATPPCDDTTPPSAPGSLVATPMNCSEVKLSWTASTDSGGSGLRGYRIQRNGALVTEVGASTTTFIDSGLSASHAYSYVVTAKDRSNNESADSLVAQTATPSCDSTSAPSTPAGLSASALVCGQIELKWNPSSDLSGAGVRGYKIYRNDKLVTEAAASSTAFSDTAVSPLAKYAYAVSAVDKAGNESRKSDPVSVTAPGCGSAYKGDFNQDLNTDLILRNNDGTVAFWTMNGTIIASGVAPYSVPTEWRIAGAGDFTRDASTDIVLQNNDQSVAFWSMDGTAIHYGLYGESLPAGARIAAAGDFNHDNQTDLVIQKTDGTVGLWLMDALAAMSKEDIATPPASWHVAGTGKFNHGSNTDMVLQNDDGTVAFWLMDGTVIASGFAPYQIPPEWKIVATGNFNGDDNTDIVLQHADGTVAFWLMNGTAISSAVTPYQVPAGWQICGPR